MTKDYYVLLKDGEGDGNELYDGDEIVLHVDSLKLTFDNILQGKSRGFQSVAYEDPSTSAAETLPTHYNRRKNNVSYKGYNNPRITISGYMSIEGIGSDKITIDSTEYRVLTPIRLFKMAISGRRFYINDYTLITWLKTTDSDSDAVYSSDGMPVNIESFSLDPLLAEDRGINYSITLIEDKE